MANRPEPLGRPRSSRQRYRRFVEDYAHRRLDDPIDAAKHIPPPAAAADADGEPAPADPKRQRRAKRRQYLREYLHWLRPYRYAVAGVFALALVVAGLEM